MLCLLVALFRSQLGAPAGATFWTTFVTLPIVVARLAYQNPPETSFLVAGGVLLVGAVWCFLAPVVRRRPLDAILLALLAFQFFFVARYANSLLTPAGSLSFGALSLPQKINLISQLALAGLLLFWSIQLPYASGYESSAPSRVTGFLKKRRLPSRIAGILLAAVAISLTVITARMAFSNESTPFLLQPPLLFGIWIALDGLYLIGRAFWQRIH